MVAGARFDRERMAAAAADELIAATDLADLLVKRGTPFREAHGVVAGLVREAVDSGLTLREVAVPALGEEAGEVLEQRSWLESKVSDGGTALARVREQLAAARALLAEG
jgi:argininosuccinate lyase